VARRVYLNGKLVPKDEATISVFDHGLLYGDGVFEGIRVYARKAFRLDKHLKRLYEGAEAIRLNVPLSTDAMIRAIEETIDANADLIDGYIRLVVTRGVGTLGLDPTLCDRGQVVIIFDTVALYPPELYEKGLDVIIARTVRNHPQSLNPSIKSLNYLNNILAKIESLDAGTAEAMMLNDQGHVTEASGDNVFIVRDGVVRTPSLEAGILEGITRSEVIRIGRDQGRQVEEVAITPDDLRAADECFLTGTAAEVIPVVRVDGNAIGDGKPGPITRAILDAYRVLTRSENA
jgi:branched-chain amino acid aminotransferase